MLSITVQPNATNITTIAAAPDTGTYAKVTIDGNNAGTYSLEVVPSAGWDDAAVTTAILNWFGLSAQV